MTLLVRQSFKKDKLQTMSNIASTSTTGNGIVIKDEPKNEPVPRRNEIIEKALRSVSATAHRQTERLTKFRGHLSMVIKLARELDKDTSKLSQGINDCTGLLSEHAMNAVKDAMPQEMHMHDNTWNHFRVSVDGYLEHELKSLDKAVHLSLDKIQGSFSGKLSYALHRLKDVVREETDPNPHRPRHRKRQQTDANDILTNGKRHQTGSEEQQQTDSDDEWIASLNDDASS